jgi:hypothetical protein
MDHLEFHVHQQGSLPVIINTKGSTTKPKHVKSTYTIALQQLVFNNTLSITTNTC